LLTGRYPLRNGLTHQLSRDENWTGIGLPHSEKILPQYLKGAGYVSACFGKWNLGFAEGSRPTERGFDEFFGCRSGNIDYYTHVYNGQEDMWRGVESVDVAGYSTDLFADAACEFIGKHAGKSFFVYVPFNAAHIPNPKNKAPGKPTIWQAPAHYFELYGYEADSTDPHEGYHAVMSALDAAVGRIVKRVDALGLRQDTIVMVMSDNGASINPNWELETGTNGPFRGGRVQVYEGGIRTPCVIRWPGRIKPGTVCHEMVANIDILPTVLRAAGIDAPTDRVIDGRDIAATLAGKSRTPHETLFFQYQAFSGARQGRWKVVRPDPADPFELYDLCTDPGEVRNLAERRPKIQSRLVAAFEQWRKQFPPSVR
jgi:arylsulfatase A-like enzyme